MNKDVTKRDRKKFSCNSGLHSDTADSTRTDNTATASNRKAKAGMTENIGSTCAEYLSLTFSCNECIGSPVYFFFTLGTNRLTDASRLVNIDELARVAKQYGLVVSVASAADSATGTPDINNTLSVARADFIVDELLKRDIPAEMIHTVSNGDIADYTPIEANLHASRVTVSLERVSLAGN